MNLIRCSQGHFYDSDSFSSCPHCITQRDPYGTGDETVPSYSPRGAQSPQGFQMSQGFQGSQNPPQPTVSVPPPADFDQTVSIFSQRSRGSGREAPGQIRQKAELRPVVGWLVCIEGPDMGRDWRLIAGHNFIGRAGDMNVSIGGDRGISRSKHAILTYDPMENAYYIQPGESHELCYRNGRVVLEPQLLAVNDVISLGNTRLLFIPCCSEQFQWPKG